MEPLPLVNRPTATQKFDHRQSTPSSWLEVASSGTGIDDKAQVGLVHLSAIAFLTPPITAEPTAVQFAVELQPIATNSLEVDSEGSGVVWTFHLPSFQISDRREGPSDD